MKRKRLIAFALALAFYASILPWGGLDAACVQFYDYCVEDLIVKESPWVDVRAHSSLSTANDNAISLGRGLLVASAITVSDNTTVSAPVYVAKGGSFSISTGVVLTITGSFDAGLYRTFTHNGTGLVRFGPGAVKRFHPHWWGVVADASTDDGPALNAMFNSARAGRALGTSPWIELPSGVMKTTVSLNGGGFGNTFIKIEGHGRSSGGSTIRGYVDNGVVLDLTGNENPLYEDFIVLGDASAVPSIGILISSAVIDGGVRGGNTNMRGVATGESFKLASVFMYGGDNNKLDSNYFGSDDTGIALYVGGVTEDLQGYLPKIGPPVSAYYTLDISVGGTTTHTQMNGQYSTVGTGRTGVLVEGVSSVFNSTNERFMVRPTHDNCSVIEYVNSGAIVNITGARDEGVGTCSFLRTDGVGGGILQGFFWSTGKPAIDLSKSYGAGVATNGTISGAIIMAQTAGASIPLFSATDNAGLLGNIIIHGNDNMVVNDPGSGLVSTNLFITTAENNEDSITIAHYNASDDGNLILARNGLHFSSGPVGTGAGIRNHLSATASLDFGVTAANTCDDNTVTVTGAVDGDTVTVGVPNALSTYAGHSFYGFVSATNTVTVRRCNSTTGTAADPAAATVRVDVWKH